MASWQAGGEEAPEDFMRILEDDDGGDVIGDDDEEYLEEVEGSSEGEDGVEEVEASLTEAMEVSTSEMVPESEVDPVAQSYVVCNEPAVQAAVSLRPLRTSPDEFRSPPWMSRSEPSPQPSTSAAAGSCSPPALDPSEVVNVVLYDDGAMDEDHLFHLADEHSLIQQVEEVEEDVAAEQPQEQRRRQQRGGVAQRGGAARRGGLARRRGAHRGRGRGRGSRGACGVAPIGDPQWARGERMVEVYLTDDDVPEELRAGIMNALRAREVARARLISRERRPGEETEEDPDYEFQYFFDAEGDSNHFEWSPMSHFQGEREQFLPQQTGAVVAPKNAYGAFRQYWDDGIMTHIVTETNRYAAWLASSSAAFARSWYDTNVHELFILFSFWMMLGIIRMPSIKSCFTTNPLLQTNIFRKMFTRSRYENLCRAFHLVDNTSRPTERTDPLFSLGPIVDHLHSRFQQSYIPSQNICIDESLTLWKGNLSFRQYIKTKAAQYGVKTYELCESSTGYLWSFFVYLGAGTSYDTGLLSTALKSTSTVLHLIRPLLDKGYTLYMDNRFNSPLLARFLKTRKTDCVGTLRANRTNVPELISMCNLKDGQFVARHSGDVVTLAFQDKKSKIATISTYHGNSQGRTEAKPHRPSVYKPQVVLDYNIGMGGIDRKDQMLEPYLLERKRGAKWNVTFFKRLLNCSIFNARVLLQNTTATPKLHSVFRLELVEQIMQHHHEHIPKIRQANRPTAPNAGHFPRRTDLLRTDGSRPKRRRCTYCSTQHNIRRDTPYVCSTCQVPLCVDSCFEAFHTM